MQGGSRAAETEIRTIRTTRALEASLSIWQRQYDTPSMEELLSELEADQRDALCVVRDWLRATIKHKPTLVYIDVVWNWCEQYTIDTPDPGDPDHIHHKGMVYLVPNPSGVRIAICSRRKFIEGLEDTPVPKSLQTGLADGVCIGDRVWCSWTLSGKDDARSLTELLGKMLDN